MISAYIIHHFTTYMHCIMYLTLPLVKATWTEWPVSFSPTLPYPNSLKEGVGLSYHVMTITWCGGQPRGCPGG